MLLILCGDISLNPGPFRYPGTVYYASVRVNQQALLCDMCQHWTHCSCCGVSVTEYQSLQVADVFSWVCPSCIAKSLPFADCSVLSSDSLLDLDVSSTSSMYAESTVFPTLPKDSTRCNLQIAQLNCRGLIAHIDDILVLAQELCIDVLALTETWLDDSVLHTELCPQHCGFSIVRKDCNRHGGGVAVLVADNVRFAVHSNLYHGSIETVWLQLFPGCKRFLLHCCAYRPPSQMMICCKNVKTLW